MATEHKEDLESIVYDVCAALHAVDTEDHVSAFRWIIGGSLPLWFLVQKEGGGKPPPGWKAGDGDIWLSAVDAKTPLTKAEIETITRLVTTKLGWNTATFFHEGGDYASFTVENCPLTLQFIGCTKMTAELDILATNGTRVLGASILDSFDLSCCQVGIVMMTAEMAAKYNALFGEKHTCYVDRKGGRPVSLFGGKSDLEACAIHHDGKCKCVLDGEGLMCENDTAAVPLACTTFAREVQRVYWGNDDVAVPFLVARPTVLAAARSCIGLGDLGLTLDFPGIPDTHDIFIPARVAYCPHPDRYATTTTWARMAKYASRGFVVAFVDVNPRLNAVRAKRRVLCDLDEVTMDHPSRLVQASAEGVMAHTTMEACNYALQLVSSVSIETRGKANAVFASKVLRAAKLVKPKPTTSIDAEDPPFYIEGGPLRAPWTSRKDDTKLPRRKTKRVRV